ncbi:hypothetical protein Mterra_01368 [Calidithermus terrae]|uniref:Uncharacterized protein n=1 Tax=Calidithermus terrae TaxID=1408545 RepID=A0A399EWR8_9DEIN|nr:hypothetical protein [Calidithermus terrae]RIH86701.1 hypothetical protein Mterra_01368 [Calidithermus terrae]
MLRQFYFPDRFSDLLDELETRLTQAPDPRLQALAKELRGLATSFWDLSDEPGQGESLLELRFLGQSKVLLGQKLAPLRLRFAELLTALALRPEGRTCEQLTLLVYGEGGNPNCCKTELCRLRDQMPISSRPYRLEIPFRADFLELRDLLAAGRVEEAVALYQGPLLPNSEAPVVVELRETLEEALRQAVLVCGRVDVLWKLAGRLRDDLELWESALRRLSRHDPRWAIAYAHNARLSRDFGVAQGGTPLWVKP